MLYQPIWSQSWQFSDRAAIGGIPDVFHYEEDGSITAFIKSDKNESLLYKVLRGKYGNWDLGDEEDKLPEIINDLVVHSNSFWVCGYSNRPDDINNGLHKFDGHNWNKISFPDKYEEEGQTNYARNYLKLLVQNDKLFVLSEAYDIKSFQSGGGTTQTLVDSIYSELWELKDGVLVKLFHVNAKHSGRLTNLVLDSDGYFWFTTWGNKGVIRWDGDFETVNLYDGVFTDSRIARSILLDNDVLIFTTNYDPSAESNQEARIFVYNTITDNLHHQEIPSFNRILDNKKETTGNRWEPKEILSNNKRLFLNLGKGIAEYNSGEFLFHDVLDYIGNYLDPHLHRLTDISDFHFEGNNLVLATNWGILTSNNFTSVEDNIYHINDFLLYPSIVDNGEIVTVTAPEDLKIRSLGMMTLDGRKTPITNFNKDGKIAVFTAPRISTGTYIVAIGTDSGTYIKQIKIR